MSLHLRALILSEGTTAFWPHLIPNTHSFSKHQHIMLLLLQFVLGKGVAQIFSSQQKKIFWYWKENVLLAEYWLSLSKSTKLNFQVIDPIVCLSPEQRCKHCWECIVCLNRMWEIRVSALVGLDGNTTSPEIANSLSVVLRGEIG